MMHQIAAGILVRDGKVLLCHRSPARRLIPNAWGFPGGHIEKDEIGRDALARELWEELGFSATIHSDEPDFSITGDDLELSAWIVPAGKGTATNTDEDEHDAVAWVTLEEATMLQLAHEKVFEWITVALSERSSAIPGEEALSGLPSEVSGGDLVAQDLRRRKAVAEG